MEPFKGDGVIAEFRGKFIVHTGHCGKGFLVLGSVLTADVCKFWSPVFWVRSNSGLPKML